MTNPVIALNVRSNQYSKLVTLGNLVVVGLTGNGNFTTPAISTVNLSAAISSVDSAISAWGTVHNRGRHADLLDLQAKAKNLYQLLKAEADYVVTTAILAAPDNFGACAAIIATSNFELKTQPVPQSTLQQVRDLQFVAAPALNRNQGKMTWRTPLGVKTPANVKSSIIYRSATTNFADAAFYAVATESEFVVTNDTASVVTWSFFVAAVGANSQIGAISNPVTITLLPA